MDTTPTIVWQTRREMLDYVDSAKYWGRRAQLEPNARRTMQYHEVAHTATERAAELARALYRVATAQK